MKKFFASILIPSLLFTNVITANALQTENISSVVLLEVVDSKKQFQYGSGFLFSSDALILTAAHVILDPETKKPSDYINVCLIQKETDIPNCLYSARVLQYNENLDLAILFLAYQIDKNGNEIGEQINIDDSEKLNLPYLDFADKKPSLGDEILILGYPLVSLTITLTKGIVSGFTPYDESFIYEINSDAIANPGNSGGPVLNNEEKIVGVLTEISIEQEGGNYSFIKANDMVYLWFLDLVSQGILTQDFLVEVFSNDLSDKPTKNDTAVFSDINLESKNFEAINYLKNNQIINGYSDGSFKSENNLNRAELLKILIEAAGYEIDEGKYQNCFPDVKIEWFAKYVCFAKEKNWISGYKDGKFKPEKNISKAEAIKISLEVLNILIEENLLGSFKDVNDTQWFSKYIKTAKKYHLLEEIGDFFQPNKEIKRRQISENIYRLLLLEKKAFLEGVIYSTCLIKDETDKGTSEEEIANISSKPQFQREIFKIFAKNGFNNDNQDALELLANKYVDNKEILTTAVLNIKNQGCPKSGN